MSSRVLCRRIASILLATFAIPALAHAQNEPVEIGKIVPNDPSDNLFGREMAVSGDLLIVGAPYDDQMGSHAGAAYVFDVRTGQQLYKLFPSDPIPDLNFGESVDIDGNLAIVGAPYALTINPLQGAAYVFDMTTGQQLRKLIGSDSLPEDHFGQRVAIRGNTAVVTAPLKGNPPQTDREGFAYVFDVTTGLQLYRLEDPTIFQNTFGVCLDMRGDQILVGSDANRLFLFDAPTGQHVHTMSGSTSTARLGEGHLISSAPGGSPQFAGDAKICDLTEELGERVFPSDVEYSDVYGASSDIQRRTALVSSPRDDDAALNAGAVYLFDSARKELLFKIVASDPVADAELGFSLALDDPPFGESEFAYIGARRTSDSSAAVYVFRLFDSFIPETVTDLHSLSHTPGEWSNAISTIMEWTPALDDQSGIAGYSVLFNFNPNTTPPEQIVIADGEKTTYSRALESKWRGYYFHIRAVDGAGNWGETEHAGPFLIDREPPRQGKMEIASGASSTPSLVVDLGGISADDQFMSGVDRVQLSNDGATWAPEEPFAQTRPGWDLSAFGGDANEGTKTVSIRFLDRAGNVSPVYTDTIEYRLAPVIDDITPAKGPLSGGNTIVVNGRSFTQDSTVTIDGASAAVTWISFDELQVVVPPGTVMPSGTGSPRRLADDVDVVVTTPNGSDTRVNGYRYLFVK